MSNDTTTKPALRPAQLVAVEIAKLLASKLTDTPVFSRLNEDDLTLLRRAWQMAAANKDVNGQPRDNTFTSRDGHQAFTWFSAGKRYTVEIKATGERRYLRVRGYEAVSLKDVTPF